MGHTFGVAVVLLILSCSGGVAQSPGCLANDFGIAYHGLKVFSVSSSNNTCSCMNYASAGLASFSNATVGTLNANTVVAGPSSGPSLVVAGDVVFSDSLSIGSNAAISGSYRCTGLPAWYYTNLQLSGAATCTQPAQQPALNWGGPGFGSCTVCGAMNCTGWSVRWSGYLKAPITGNVTLSITCDDGVRLYLDNSAAPAIDAWLPQTVPTTYQVTLDMVAGAYTPLRLEYFQNAGAFSFVLQWFWSGAGGSLAQIPTTHLCSANGVQVLAGTSSFTGQTSFYGPVLFVTGIGTQTTPTTINGPLTVSGTTTLSSALAVNAPVTLAALNVSGPTILSSALTVNAPATFASANVTGVTHLSSSLTVNAAATFASATVTGATSLNGVLAVSGATLMAAPLTVNAAVWAASLTVNGTTTISGATTMNAATVNGALTANNGVVASTLAVSGPATFASPTTFTTVTLQNATATGGGFVVASSSGGVTFADGTKQVTGRYLDDNTRSYCLYDADCAGGRVCASRMCVRPPVGGSITLWIEPSHHAGVGGTGVVYDLSGNGRNGLMGANSGAPGLIGNPVRFIDYPAAPITANPTTFAPFTQTDFRTNVPNAWTVQVSVFVRASSAGDLGILSHNGASGTNQMLHLILRGMAPLMGFYANDLQSTTVLAAGVDYNIAFRFDPAANGGTQSVFVNGYLDCTQPFAGSGVTSAFPMVVGASINGGNPLNGRIYNLLIYSRALSDAEILQNAQASTDFGVRLTFPPYTRSFVTSNLRWAVDFGNPASYPGTGTTLFDLSGNNLNVVFTAAPAYTSATGSISFTAASRNTVPGTLVPNALSAWTMQIVFRTPPAIVAGTDYYVFGPGAGSACTTANCLHVVIRNGQFFIGTWAADCQSTQLANPNQDYVFTAGFNAGNMFVYINSRPLTLPAACAGKPQYVTGQALEIGSSNGNNRWGSLFYSARFYTVALTQAQINQNIQMYRDAGRTF